MATIYLDNTTYNEAALYAKLNNRAHFKKGHILNPV